MTKQVIGFVWIGSMWRRNHVDLQLEYELSYSSFKLALHQQATSTSFFIFKRPTSPQTCSICIRKILFIVQKLSCGCHMCELLALQDGRLRKFTSLHELHLGTFSHCGVHLTFSSCPILPMAIVEFSSLQNENPSII